MIIMPLSLPFLFPFICTIHPYTLNMQFDDIGAYGTKVIICNLWFNDDCNLELDFDTDLKVMLLELLIFLLYCYFAF